MKILYMYQTVQDGLFQLLRYLDLLLVALCILDSRDCGFSLFWIFGIVDITFLCFFFGALITVITATESDTIDHIEYKVTIDDSVSMNEFLDKYEILDQEGKIYTVKERE